MAFDSSLEDTLRKSLIKNELDEVPSMMKRNLEKFNIHTVEDFLRMKKDAIYQILGGESLLNAYLQRKEITPASSKITTGTLKIFAERILLLPHKNDGKRTRKPKKQRAKKSQIIAKNFFEGTERLRAKMPKDFEEYIRYCVRPGSIRSIHIALGILPYPSILEIPLHCSNKITIVKKGARYKLLDTPTTPAELFNAVGKTYNQSASYGRLYLFVQTAPTNLPQIDFTRYFLPTEPTDAEARINNLLRHQGNTSMLRIISDPIAGPLFAKRLWQEFKKHEYQKNTTSQIQFGAVCAQIDFANLLTNFRTYFGIETKDIPELILRIAYALSSKATEDVQRELFEYERHAERKLSEAGKIKKDTSKLEQMKEHLIISNKVTFPKVASDIYEKYRASTSEPLLSHTISCSDITFPFQVGAKKMGDISFKALFEYICAQNSHMSPENIKKRIIRLWCLENFPINEALLKYQKIMRNEEM